MKTVSFATVIFIVVVLLPGAVLAVEAPPGTLAQDLGIPQDVTEYPEGVTYTMGTQLVGPVALPGTKSDFTDVGIVLEKGKPYYIRGEGIVSFWSDRDYGVDSVFCYDSPFTGQEIKLWGPLGFQGPDITLAQAIERQTGQPPVYNANHTYEGVVFGTGGPLKARVGDGGMYSDNSGTLYVSVFQAIPSGTGSGGPGFFGGDSPETLPEDLGLSQDVTEYPEGVTYTMGAQLAGPVALPAEKSDYTDVGIVLEKGKPYYIRGEGIIGMWTDWDHGVDSVICYNHKSDGQVFYVWGQLQLQSPDIRLSEAIERQTGQPPVYNPSHVYEGVVFGTGDPLKARVLDTGDYGDNSDALYISVFQAIPSSTGSGGGGSGGGSSASETCTANVFYYGVLVGFAQMALDNNVDKNWAASMLEQAYAPAAAAGLPSEVLGDLITRCRSGLAASSVAGAVSDWGKNVGRQAARLCECNVFGAGVALGYAEAAAGANLRAATINGALSNARSELAGFCGLNVRIGQFEDRLNNREPALTVYPDIAAERVNIQNNLLDSLCRCAYPTWDGKWDTNHGFLILRVDGNQVTGTLDQAEDEQIEGTISEDGRTLAGTWAEPPSYAPPNDKGRFVLQMDEDGLRFWGTWGYGEDSTTGGGWNGDRGTN